MEISSTAELEMAIEQLRLKSEVQKESLKEHFNIAVESLKPANLLKSAVSNIAHHPGIASAAIGTTAGMGAGVLSRKLVVGRSHNVFRKLMGTVIEFAVARGVANNSDFIAERGIRLLKKLSQNIKTGKNSNTKKD